MPGPDLKHRQQIHHLTDAEIIWWIERTSISAGVGSIASRWNWLRLTPEEWAPEYSSALAGKSDDLQIAYITRNP